MSAENVVLFSWGGVSVRVDYHAPGEFGKGVRHERQCTSPQCDRCSVQGIDSARFKGVEAES